MCRTPLRFSHLSFIPLEPYPARYARHLPHAGKALSVVILFPHMCVFALTLWGKRYSRIVAFPAWGRGTAPAVDRVLMGESLCLQTHFSDVSALFHTASTSSAPTGHLPHGEGGPRQRRSGALVNRLLETHFPTLFHTASALSAPTGHLSLEGKAE